jgi:hypothetical protein
MKTTATMKTTAVTATAVTATAVTPATVTTTAARQDRDPRQNGREKHARG